MNGTYLYAVISDAAEPPAARGIQESKVYTVRSGPLAAIVSDLPRKGRLRPDRRNIAAHHGVLRGLDETAGVLPLAFGMVADSRESVRSLLLRNRERLQASIQRVRGRCEMGVRVRLDVPDVFEYYVEAYPELREARDRIYGNGRNPTHSEKVALGRLFERILEETRATCCRTVADGLEPATVEVVSEDPRGEGELAVFACLIERDGAPGFREALQAAAAAFDDRHTFDCSGPFPPHHFADVHLAH